MRKLLLLALLLLLSGCGRSREGNPSGDPPEHPGGPGVGFSGVSQKCVDEGHKCQSRESEIFLAIVLSLFAGSMAHATVGCGPS